MDFAYQKQLHCTSNFITQLLAPQYTGSKSVGLASDSPMGLYFAAPSEMGTTLQTLLIPTDSPMQVQNNGLTDSVFGG